MWPWRRWQMEEKALEVERALAALGGYGTAVGINSQAEERGTAIGYNAHAGPGQVAALSHQPWYLRLWCLMVFVPRYLFTGKIVL